MLNMIDVACGNVFYNTLLVEMSSTTRCLWKCLLQHLACGNVFYNTLLVELSSTTRCLCTIFYNTLLVYHLHFQSFYG